MSSPMLPNDTGLSCSLDVPDVQGKRPRVSVASVSGFVESRTDCPRRNAAAMRRVTLSIRADEAAAFLGSMKSKSSFDSILALPGSNQDRDGPNLLTARMAFSAEASGTSVFTRQSRAEDNVFPPPAQEYTPADTVKVFVEGDVLTLRPQVARPHPPSAGKQ